MMFWLQADEGNKDYSHRVTASEKSR